MQALGWRRCLSAFLLIVSVTDVFGDLNNGTSTADSRTGYSNDILYTDNSNESKAVDEAETIADTANLGPEHEENENKRRTNPELDDSNKEMAYNMELDEKKYKKEPPVNPDVLNDDKSPLSKGQFIEPVVHDQLVFPKDPTHEKFEIGNEYPYASDNQSEPGLLGSTLFKRNKLFTRLVPIEEHILLHKIPGAENALVCEREGEIHNFWAPDLQCMVCVCLAAYGRLRPACVSCQSCMVPPPGPVTRPPPPPPITTPAPIEPPVPSDVSCKPLPVDVPFQSPLDPCKICICSETLDQWGRPDVRINCRHNPQCVLPTTQHPIITTPVPQHVCDKFPPDVPFPHPQDSCQICKCKTARPAHGAPRAHVVCTLNPACQPTTKPSPPAPITDVPGPEICERFPENVLFPHPHDRCQVCKCTVHSNLVYDKKTVTCYLQPNCLPDTETPAPVTEIPDAECSGYPENVLFPHPRDPCKICQCSKDYSNFIPVVKMNCYVTPNCGTTTTTLSPWTPPPQPENVRCAPLPTGRPFQSPLNPCHMCICTESVDVYGRHDVNIQCQESPQCVLPPDHSTIPPDIIDPVHLKECRYFPENVFFPHPSDPCKMCKCNVGIGQYNRPELVISCVVKPECLPPPPPPPPPTTETPPGPDPMQLCDRYPDNVIFPDPTDECKLCRCYRDPRHGFKRIINCFLKPKCVPTPVTTPGPAPVPIVSCAPLPSGKPFQSPINPCQVCLCTERTDMFGRHDVSIECQLNPQCVTPPDTPSIPPVIVVPIHSKVCKLYPLNVYFPHPSEKCSQCKCTAQKNNFGQFEEYIRCAMIPNCVPSPPPVTPEPPVPDGICRLPYGTLVPDPSDPCRVCKCELVRPPGSVVPVPLQTRVTCFILPQCTIKPTTDKNIPNEVCGNHPINTPFDDPNDPCRVCTCSYKGTGSTTSGHDLQNAWNPKQLQILCYIKPECLPPSPPSTPSPPYGICDYQEVDVPFTDPHDPCRSCVCHYSPGSAPGSGLASAHNNELSHALPTKQLKCILKPECYPPSPEPIKKDVSCKPLPSGIPFPNPMNPCAICICTETVDLYGEPDVSIKCQENPQCVLPPDATTLPPLNPTSPMPFPACKNFPTNVLFPHPRDPCQECKCSVETTPWGQQEQTITCYENYDNPQCGLTPPTTPAPWPPAPPGPLPGPAPHESCSPYKPNAPFQHPWDECQVCVCKEAISSERITIEINCYTSPSCCYEPPFDKPGSSGIGNANLITNKGSGSDASIISPPGNRIGPIGGKNIKNSESYGASAAILRQLNGIKGSLDQTADDSMGGIVVQETGQNWIGPQSFGTQQIKYRNEDPSSKTENVIGSTSGNFNGPSGSSIIRPIEGDVISPSGGNVIDSIIHSTGGNLIGPTGGNLIRPSGGKIEGVYPYLNGNLFLPNRGNLLIKTNGLPEGTSIRKQTLHYSIKPEEVTEAKLETEAPTGQNTKPVASVSGQQYSTKMRTKSARPSDDDSEDYD